MHWSDIFILIANVQYINSNKIPRLSGHFSIFSLVLFVLNSFLGIARQWSREKFAIFSHKPLEVMLDFDISNVGY